MSVLLIGSSFATTLLIPAEAFQKGGEANGRALAYLAHEHLGDVFGTVYDVSTIAILWFAGASAMAGLLNLVPRYLPRYGMAPEWTRATRPLVLVFTAIALPRHHPLQRRRRRAGRRLRDRRAGADDLGRGRRHAAACGAQRAQFVAFGVITLVFAYTTVVNVIERPDGLKIAVLVHPDDHRHVAGVARDAIHRAARRRPSNRTTVALRFIRDAAATPVRIIANRPDTGLPEDTTTSCATPASHTICRTSGCCSWKSGRATCPSSAARCRSSGADVAGHHVLRCVSPAIPNAIAALLLYIRDETGRSRMPTSAGRKAIPSSTC